MPLLRMNATDQGLHLHHTGADALSQIAEVSQRTGGPAIVMIHGFKYDPHADRHCPQRKLFGAQGANWPHALGFDQSKAGEGLGIALGWSARGPLRQVHRRATRLGLTLAELVGTLKANHPARPVHVIAHSLGSEIALAALEHLPPRAVDRILLLTGASFCGFADDMLATPAGRTAEVFNITSRENDVFDLAFETLVRAQRQGDRALGQGLSRPNALNIQLDCDRSLAALAQFGTPITTPKRQICHWSSYTRPGAMSFYAKLLRQPEAYCFRELQGALPDDQDPRWSRLGLGCPNVDICHVATESLAAVTLRLRHKATLFKRAFSKRDPDEPAFLTSACIRSDATTPS
ncbi:hypothetical protein So717_04960 [Roseobacter cerasinus]|uniref:Uncharacterized protein n=1 Tax=Roseobacter cerasinus TaxID=2602289 RepID=A0A640VKA1_9RHOB|nr:hypothetical protein [Roseobacter cerasinus]GFE48743.1 hypothetical protein So717_04960 [Roseobacter cerasinus]